MRYWAPLLESLSTVAKIKVYFAKWSESGAELFESVYKATSPTSILYDSNGQEETPSITFSDLPNVEHDLTVSTNDPGSVQLVRDEIVDVDGIRTRQMTYSFTSGDDEGNEEDALDDDDEEDEDSRFTLRPDVGHEHDEL